MAVEIFKTYRLRHAELQVLREMARRGRRMDWDIENVRLQRGEEAARAADAVARSLVEQGLAKLVEVVSHAAQARGTVYLIMTDAGARVVESHERDIAAAEKSAANHATPR